MERLITRCKEYLIPKATEIGEDCVLSCDELCGHIGGKCEDCAIQKCFDKLAEYEDAEEQGSLIRPPVKIGDKVYSPTRNFLSEYTVCSIEVYNEGFFFNWRCDDGIYINVRGFTNFEIGKTVFLTKEEAEQTLQALKEGVKNE